MRIWSIHPKYLDAKGLVALWRETLLAKNVLEGKTKGYKYHPQLIRFRSTKNPVAAINVYLKAVYEEAVSRAYNFNREKIIWRSKSGLLEVTNGQMEYERKHLQNKLKDRDSEKYEDIIKIKILEPHPIFKTIEGDIEAWEIL